MPRPHIVLHGLLALALIAGVATAAPVKRAPAGARAPAQRAPAKTAAADSVTAAPATSAPAAKGAEADSGMTLRGGQEGTVFRTLTIEGEDRVHVDFERPALDLDLDPTKVAGLDIGTARDVLDRTLPVYPEWAKQDGVEGVVTLYFVVRADGTVRENVLVQRTAGFEDFDENARVALRAWRFEPLRGGRTGEQWGTITFQFRLRDLN